MRHRQVVLLFFINLYLGYSQCAMCRVALQSSDQKNIAQGVNNGITYLMSVPYILFVVLGLLIYRAVTKRKKRLKN